MIRWKYYKKIIICGNISLVIALWADIFIAYIALNPIFTFIRYFYRGDLANFAGGIIIFFVAAVIIRWFGLVVALPRWTWLLLLLRYFFIDSRTWWHLLSPSSPPKLLWPYFAVTNSSVSLSMTHLRFLGKLFSGVSSKLFGNSRGNSYFKKD